jgi:exonuclease VII small subunit
MTTPESGDPVVPVTDLSYTKASRELDAIVEFFEQRDVDVDQLVVRLERATAIVDELDRRVRKTRTQVEELVPRLEAVNRDHNRGPTDEYGDVDDSDEGDDLDPDGEPTDGADDEGDEQALF